MIHPSAIIAEDAIIADDASIGPFCVIGSKVEIGSGTRINSHVVIDGPTTIGKDNRIFQFASIGDEPQDKKYRNEPTRLEIGDRNTIREYCTISRGTVDDESLTSMGDDNWLMAYVHVAHDCRIGNQTIMANGTALAGHVTVGDWAIFAGYSGAHQFCRIGAHAFLGMQAGTSRDVPAYVMIAGQPPTPRGINSEGLKRRGFTAEQIRNLKDAYKIVYRQGAKLAEAIAELEQRLPEQPELGLLIDSLHTTDRGLVR